MSRRVVFIENLKQVCAQDDLFRKRHFHFLALCFLLHTDADKAVTDCLLNQMWAMDYKKDTQLHRLEPKQKISLPTESKPEDTLKMLRLNQDTSGHMWLSDSPSKSCAGSLDGSRSEDSVVSGPSSPSALRCRKCENLFTKMKRQGPPRKKQRDKDPGSLSCDVWLLNKTWHPQIRQQSRGRLWVYLKHIRLRAAKQSDDGMTNKAWSHCSRPHVFLERNLRHCKKMVGKPIKSKANPVHQQRNRAKPLHSGKHQRQKKRKSLEKDDTSGHLSPVDLTLEDELPANEGLQRLEKVSKKQSVSDVSGFMDMQADGSGLEGTRRVLKFDIPPAAALAETHTPKHHPVHRSARTKLHEGQAYFTAENRDCPRKLDDVLSEDSAVFRSPMDHFSADLKITRKSRSSRPFDTRKDSFRTMLAALGQGHNQIIKESRP